MVRIAVCPTDAWSAMLDRMDLQLPPPISALDPPPASLTGLGARADADRFRSFYFLFQNPVKYVKFQSGFDPK